MNRSGPFPGWMDGVNQSTYEEDARKMIFTFSFPVTLTVGVKGP